MNSQYYEELRRIAGGGDSWEPYSWQVVDNGIIIKGCATSVYIKGPRKGQKKYLIKSDHKTIAISDEENMRIIKLDEKLALDAKNTSCGLGNFNAD